MHVSEQDAERRELEKTARAIEAHHDAQRRGQKDVEEGERDV